MPHQALHELDAHTPVYACSHVRSTEAGITTIMRDDEGDFLAFCDVDHDGEQFEAMCLHEVLALDGSLADLVLCGKQQASRETADGSFRIHDPVDDDIERTVETHGWFIAKFIEDDNGPDFAYSIGLARTLKVPEIIVMGLPADTGAIVINKLGNLARQQGALPLDTHIPNILSGNFDVVLRAVRDRESYRRYLGYGCHFHGGDWFPVVQCLWPDKANRFPFEADCAPFVREKQPLLP